MESNNRNLKHQTKVGIYWTFFNSFATFGLQFAVGIIMARLLCPADYGTAALPVVFLSVADLFITGGFTAAIIRKPDLKEQDLSTAFLYSIIVGVTMYLLLFASSPYIADFYNVPVLSSLIRVVALQFLWNPLLTPQNIILTRNLDFKKQTVITIVTKIVGAIIGIALAYRGYGVWALAVSGVVSGFLCFAMTWLCVRWLPSTGWSKESFHYLWGYGNKMLTANIIDIVYVNLTPLLIGKFYSTTDLGVYNRADNFAHLPSKQGASILQRVTFPVLSKMQADDISLAHNYRRMLKVSAFVIFPIMMLLAALAKPFVIILVSEKWSDSILLLQLLCFSSMWYPIHSINTNLLQVKGRPDYFLRIEVWKKIIGLMLLVCTLPFGITCFVASGIISSFLILFINTYYTGKIIGLGFISQLRDLLPTYSLSILIFITVLAINTKVNDLWLQLLVGSFVGFTLYTSLASFFKFREIEDVKYMILTKRRASP